MGFLFSGGFDCCGGEQGGGLYGKCPFPAWAGCETNSSTDSGSQLLVRWLQHGALSAVDRSHCGGCNREFWTFPNFESMKDAMHFRIALFPYLYSENHRTRITGVSLLHPLYYNSPDLDKSYTVPSEYFFGPEMLVQPIVAPIAAGETTITTSTWLPPGCWIDWAGKTIHQSGDGAVAGMELSAEYTIHEIPIFVRAGAVIPMRTAASLKTTLAFSDPLVWGVWPGDGTNSALSGGNSTVVEDDGATLRFEAGQQSSTTMQWSRGQDGSLTLAVAPTSGSFDVGCTVENGFEYGGAGTDLQEVGPVESEGACCDACEIDSNCAYWTWSKTTQICILKVSRKGQGFDTCNIQQIIATLVIRSRSMSIYVCFHSATILLYIRFLPSFDLVMRDSTRPAFLERISTSLLHPSGDCIRTSMTVAEYVS